MMSFARRSSKSKESTKSTPQQLPPSLASELLMMQFIGGGSIERNAKRMMEQHARDIAPTSRTHHQHPHHQHPHHSTHHHSDREQRRRKSRPTMDPRLPLSEAYRDEREKMCWDEHEAVEFKGLLTPTQHEQSQGWAHYDPFGATSSPTSTMFSVTNIPVTPYPNVQTYPSYADRGVIPYGASASPYRRRGSAVHPSSGFEDSYYPIGMHSGCVAPHTDPVIKKKTGMNLRGRARALFGGH